MLNNQPWIEVIIRAHHSDGSLAECSLNLIDLAESSLNLTDLELSAQRQLVFRRAAELVGEALSETWALMQAQGVGGGS
jgi:hypothetical protein